jgi:hypothetical protein
MSTPRRRDADNAAGEEVLAEPADSSSGSTYRLSRAAIVLIALALGVGLLIGRASVKSDSSAAPTPTPTATHSASSVPLGPNSLASTGAMCSVQVGNKLTLGLEVRNTSTVPIILKRLNVSLPMGGLKILARGVGSCGEFNVPRLEDFGLAPQGAVWFSTTVRPSEQCPAPYPVLMTVAVTDPTGAQQTINVGGFKDLGNVPWSGCSTASP